MRQARWVAVLGLALATAAPGWAQQRGAFGGVPASEIRNVPLDTRGAVAPLAAPAIPGQQSGLAAFLSRLSPLNLFRSNNSNLTVITPDTPPSSSQRSPFQPLLPTSQRVR